MDWYSITKYAQEAFREGVNEWISKARVQGGRVNGPAANLTPGSLISDVNIESKVSQKLIGAKVPSDIALALAKQLGSAWGDWAAGFQMQIPGAYPTFAAFPGPVAPPTPAATRDIPLSQGRSTGEASLKATVLANTLITAVRVNAKQIGGGTPDAALKGLANWVESSFVEWRSLVKLVGLMGKGPVPTFAPPYVPVGPVIQGVNVSTGPVFAGPRFGKVVI